jgi:uncharacterized protein (UPF0333 family)
MERRLTPAQIYSLLIGAVLVVAGIIGFFYESKFTSDKSVRDGVLGILDVNGWHNVVHIASGLAGLALWRTAAGARTYALGLGVVYTAVAIWGFIIGDGDSILSIVPVNTEDNVLHVLIALAGFAMYSISDPARVDRPAATAAT